MKKTIVKVAAFVAVVALSFGANAQDAALGRMIYGGGVDIQFPTGITMFGAHGQVEKPFADKITGTGSLAVLYGSAATSSTTIQFQVLAGGRYYITETQKGIYVGVDLGYSRSITTTNSVTFTGGDVAFGGGAGYQLEKFDIGARFLAQTGGGFGLRAAYLF